MVIIMDVGPFLLFDDDDTMLDYIGEFPAGYYFPREKQLDYVKKRYAK